MWGVPERTQEWRFGVAFIVPAMLSVLEVSLVPSNSSEVLSYLTSQVLSLHLLRSVGDILISRIGN